MSLGACYWLWCRRRAEERGEVKPGHNPFELDDAITLAMADLARNDAQNLDVAAHAIVIAAQARRDTLPQEVAHFC